MSQDAITRFNCSLPYFTNIPEDVVVNSWHLIFEDGIGTPPNITDYGNALDNFKTFYDSVYTTLARAAWVGSTMTIKAYDLQLPEPRVPIFSGNRTIAGVAAAAGAAPPEAAICMSYRGNYIGGVPQARQRGRIFLGGFAQPTAVGSAASFPEVSAGVRTNICTAASTLRTNMLADNWTWIVYSPTNGAAGGQESFNTQHGWVDNAIDTQRRRGNAASARTTW